MIQFKYRRRKDRANWWVFAQEYPTCKYQLIGELNTLQNYPRNQYRLIINGENPIIHMLSLLADTQYPSRFTSRNAAAKVLFMNWTDAQRLFHVSRSKIQELENTVNKRK